jgi:C4-dicarboxylate transporter DctM subunit
MDPYWVGILGIALLFSLLAVGVHIGVALGLVGILGSTMIVGFEASIYTSVSNIYHKIASFELITIPLFVLMGYLASGGGISRNVFDSLNRWIGHIRGGLGIATVASCTAFGAVCGSALVTASVFARFCAPEMRRLGYDKRLAYAICASAGVIGMLIPPSILMVVYGVLAGESTGKLLIAGITPGILLMVLFSLTIVFIGWRKPEMLGAVPRPEILSLSQKLRLLINIWPVLLVAVIMFGGIFGGIFNPTEAAAVATVALLILLVATRFEDWLELFRIAFLETGATSAMIFLVMGSATVFSQFLVLTGIAEQLVDAVGRWALSKATLIWVIVGVYLFLGCLLDSISMLCITVPLFNPIIKALGVDPIWYAVVIVMAIHAGLLTPPVGLNVYATYAVAEKDVTLEEIFSGVIPFLLAMGVSLLILVYIPLLSTFLPELMLGK